MTIDFTIDNHPVTLSVNSNKPLNLILMEDFEEPLMQTRCRDGNCGNCIVLLNDEAVLSCLIPAFMLKGVKILTYQGYQKTRFWHDLERACEDTGSKPCRQCIASRTLIFESLLKLVGKTTTGERSDALPDAATVVRELRLNTCDCLGSQEMMAIFTAAAAYRRRRRVRRN